MRNPWKTLSSRAIYRNPWMAVREDRVIQPDGQPSRYGVVMVKPYVGVVPCDRGGVYLVRQWRYAQEKNIWEIPTGTRHPGESPLAAAQRELAEEVKMAARKWRRLGPMLEMTSIANCRGDLYLAESLFPASGELDGSEADLVVRWFAWPEVFRWIDRGRLADAVTVAGLLMAHRALCRQ